MAKDEWRGERFVITRQRLDGARRRLRIAEPVEIRFTRYTKAGFGGRLSGFKEGSWRIGLDKTLSVNEASRTLWHELVHVAQARRMGGFPVWDKRVQQEMRDARLNGPHPRKFFCGHAYNRMPLEREAERRGRRWHKRFTLADPR